LRISRIVPAPGGVSPRAGGEVEERWLLGRSTTGAGKHDGERGGVAASHEGHGGGKAVGSNAHHGGHGDHAALYRSRFWVSLVLSVPVILYSEMIQMWLGFSMPEFPGSGWVAPFLGTFVFLWGGGLS